MKEITKLYWAVVLFILLLFIGIILISSLPALNSWMSSTLTGKTCESQCSSLGFTFYKLDAMATRWENCWCFDKDNKPISTGWIK